MKIETLVRWDGKSSAVEEWSIAHGSAGAVVYKVKITPDGQGGAYFQVEKKK